MVAFEMMRESLGADGTLRGHTGRGNAELRTNANHRGHVIGAAAPSGSHRRRWSAFRRDAVAINLGDLGTKGGLQADASARLLDGAGQPIPHLYAAGKASARPPNPPEESQMPRYKLVVMSGPQDGRAAEYHDWYQNSHLQQVMELPGFQAGQRYRLSTALIEGETFPFLAIYDIETDDVDSVLAEMRSRAGTERLTVSDALAPKAYAVLYEEFGARVTAKDSPS
jgi:hypothetical protein